MRSETNAPSVFFCRMATDDEIATLATPSNVRLGREIADTGGVTITQKDEDTITARVQPEDGSTRSVRLVRTEDGWAGTCSCTSERTFCKHCVAALLAAE